MGDPFRPVFEQPIAAGPLDDAWLTIVGIGDGGLDGLSSEALDALHAAQTIFGGERHLTMLDDLPAERVAWRSPFTESIPELLSHHGRPTVVLATGDPMWFGAGATLMRHLEAGEVRVLPSPAAFQLAAARLAWPLAECRCLTVHGRPLAMVSRHLYPGAKLLIYSADGNSPQSLARLLTGRGYGPSRIHVLEHLGGPKERVRQTSAIDFDLTDVADLNTVAVECVAGRAAEPRPLVPGLPDDAFIHDGNMTKRVLRALAIAALSPQPGDLLWDIGAGAGSVSIEWLRSSEGVRAVAIEHKEARLAMIRENADVFGVPDLQIVHGKAPDALDGLDHPDAVFIGGGLTDGVFDAAHDALRPGGRLVAHAVTLESEAILIDFHARFGGELMRVSVEHAEPVGPYRGFRPAMPVLHWHMTKARA